MTKDDKKEPVEELTGVWERKPCTIEEVLEKYRALYRNTTPRVHTVLEAEYEVKGEKPLEKRETPDGNIVIDSLSCIDADGNVFEHYDSVTIDKRVFEGSNSTPYQAIRSFGRVQRRFPPVGEHRELLLGRVPQVIKSYETATTPKEKYKA